MDRTEYETWQKKMKEGLMAASFSESASERILDVFLSLLQKNVLPINVTPKSLELIGLPNVKLTFFGFDGNEPKTDEPLATRNFQLEIDGIDPMQIKSVALPKLDYADNDVLTLAVELFPFTVQPILKAVQRDEK